VETLREKWGEQGKTQICSRTYLRSFIYFAKKEKQKGGGGTKCIGGKKSRPGFVPCGSYQTWCLIWEGQRADRRVSLGGSKSYKEEGKVSRDLQQTNEE